MEPEIIIIEDSDDEVMIVDEVAEEEIINVEDAVINPHGVFDNMEVIEPIYDLDYSSDDCSDNFDETTTVQFTGTAEILTINASSKVCVSYCYHIPCDTIKLCTNCFKRNVDLFPHIYTIHQHRTMRFNAIEQESCSDCHAPLYIIYTRNICPICIHHCKY